MGIDNPCETQKRHDLGANIRAIVEPVVVEKHPEGKNSVQVGIVRQHDPVALGEVETLANQYHRLFAGGQGSNASFAVIEVVELLLNVDERIALRCAVEKNSSSSVFARLVCGYRESTLGPHRHRGRFHACEYSCLALLSDVIAIRNRRGLSPIQVLLEKPFSFAIAPLAVVLMYCGVYPLG